MDLWWPSCRCQALAGPARFQLGDARLDAGRPYTSWRSYPFQYQHSAAFLDCKMWIFGGFVEATVGDAGGIRNTLLSFDIQTETWANVALTGGPGNVTQHLGVMGSNGMWIYGGYALVVSSQMSTFLKSFRPPPPRPQHPRPP